MYMYGDEKSLIPTWYRELWIRGRRVMLPIHICNSAIKCSRTLSTGGCIKSTWFWIRISCRRICNKAIIKSKVEKNKNHFQQVKYLYINFWKCTPHMKVTIHMTFQNRQLTIRSRKRLYSKKALPNATAMCRMTKMWFTCKMCTCWFCILSKYY